ncbi:hypothetical protein C8Q77DRAFT_188911 [Trametes polyzona]|nr:hypothetical protein C8Q77DRAFT_188911 [Trametes polyzona]
MGWVWGMGWMVKGGFCSLIAAACCVAVVVLQAVLFRLARILRVCHCLATACMRNVVCRLRGRYRCIDALTERVVDMVRTAEREAHCPLPTAQLKRSASYLERHLPSRAMNTQHRRSSENLCIDGTSRLAGTCCHY